jgi:hypothetical protein
MGNGIADLFREKTKTKVKINLFGSGTDVMIFKNIKKH